jgi:hypothetical protein
MQTRKERRTRHPAAAGLGAAGPADTASTVKIMKGQCVRNKKRNSAGSIGETLTTAGARLQEAL